ncbi:MAG: hypothetical protein KDD45_06345 [Bdellovibrionales bacterium]|nr:hypothetical protein [Bdellovibrionales bacterium]
MKKLILSAASIVLLFTSSLALSLPSPAIKNLTSKKDFIVSGNDFVPIPWGKELPISWETLPGTWILRQGKESNPSYFTFRPIRTLGQSEMLYIQQIDPKTCQVLGAGVATQFDSKIIYATLRSAVNNQVYRINFRNYDARSFNSSALPTYEGHVMLMSIAPINSYEFAHYPLARVNFSSQSNINCMKRLVR